MSEERNDEDGKDFGPYQLEELCVEVKKCFEGPAPKGYSLEIFKKTDGTYMLREWYRTE